MLLATLRLGYFQRLSMGEIQTYFVPVRISFLSSMIMIWPSTFNLSQKSHQVTLRTKLENTELEFSVFTKQISHKFPNFSFPFAHAQLIECSSRKLAWLTIDANTRAVCPLWKSDSFLWISDKKQTPPYKNQTILIVSLLNFDYTGRGFFLVIFWCFKLSCWLLLNLKWRTF